MIEVRDVDGKLIRTLQHQINAQDIHRAFAELHLTPDLLKPAGQRYSTTIRIRLIQKHGFLTS